MDLIIKKATENGWKISAHPIYKSGTPTGEYEWSLKFSANHISKEFCFVADVNYFAYELGEIYQAFDVQSEADKNKMFIPKLSYGEILQEYKAIDVALCQLEKAF